MFSHNDFADYTDYPLSVPIKTFESSNTFQNRRYGLKQYLHV